MSRSEPSLSQVSETTVLYMTDSLTYGFWIPQETVGRI